MTIVKIKIKKTHSWHGEQ